MTCRWASSAGSSSLIFARAGLLAARQATSYRVAPARPDEFAALRRPCGKVRLRRHRHSSVLAARIAGEAAA
ncbi:MAG: hypothetical protein M3325_18190 [Actinomycetota bacterium]|nr:hypothetical protein [Actinomycetota bacterium]MDQ3906581.1 hypothetical protein [Actinomycetota bacterium]